MSFIHYSRLQQVGSLVLVGILWGCTNPILLLQKKKASSTTNRNREEDTDGCKNGKETFLSSIIQTIKNASVSWLPFYLLNQLGSVVFYFCLSQSDLSLTVPVCNAMALLFSILTSLYIGEPLQYPVQTVVGATLVMVGTMVCLQASLKAPVEGSA